MGAPQQIAFATVGKPHGIRGAVTVLVSEHHIGVIVPGFRCTVELRGQRTERVVAGVQGTQARPIVRFEGAESRNDAELLRGAALLADRSALTPLDDDEFFFGDLEGCEVFANGALVGSVRRVRALPTQELLEVTGPGVDLLVPFTRECVPAVDIAARRVEIDPVLLEVDEA